MLLQPYCHCFDGQWPRLVTLMSLPLMYSPTAGQGGLQQPACVVPCTPADHTFLVPIALRINIQWCDLQGIPQPQQLSQCLSSAPTPDPMLLHVLFVRGDSELTLKGLASAEKLP